MAVEVVLDNRGYIILLEQLQEHYKQHQQIKVPELEEQDIKIQVTMGPWDKVIVEVII